MGNHKAVITFMGRSITSKFGVWLFKFMSIVVPLLPTFALVLYNGIQLESLITRSNLLQKSFEQVNSITIFWFESFAWIWSFFLGPKCNFIVSFDFLSSKWKIQSGVSVTINIKRWTIESKVGEYNKCPRRYCKQQIHEIMYWCFFFVAKEFWISVLNTYFHSVRYISENHNFVLYFFILYSL